MKRGTLHLLLGAALVAVTLAHVAYFFPRVVDDVFISLRYAENLAGGHGAVYNVGERVEGYSSPAWMLLQALGFVVSAEPVAFVKFLGVASLLATAFGLRALAKSAFGVDGWPGWIPAFACVANPYVVSWAVLGLETPLHLAALVLCPLAVHRAMMAGPTARRPRVLAASALVLLGMTRPESPLYVVLNALAPLALARGAEDSWRARVRDAARFCVPAALVLGALLGLRLAYYGALFPNTYYVKGAHAEFAIDKLRDLWGQGTVLPEALMWVGGGLALVVYGVRTRVIAPALTFLACLHFTASVAPDWMPSMRHLLPALVFAPLGCASFVHDLWRLTRVDPEPAVPPSPPLPRMFRGLGRAEGVICVLGVMMTLGSAAYRHARIDYRLSPSEQSKKWIFNKTAAKWQDTLLSFERLEPPHVKSMGSYEMGQITMAWGALEASAEPVTDSWFAGRDIGALGFYTGVRVFDTAGLVTREVSRSPEWQNDGHVPESLALLMMSHRPVAAEIYEGWEVALGRHPELLDGYAIRRGSRRQPIAFIADDRPKPTLETVVKRYEAMVAKFPRLFHLHTLYGESVGAVVERRLRIVRSAGREAALSGSVRSR